jgi:hypothetical protein
MRSGYRDGCDAHETDMARGPHDAGEQVGVDVSGAGGEQGVCSPPILPHRHDAGEQDGVDSGAGEAGSEASKRQGPDASGDMNVGSVGGAEVAGGGGAGHACEGDVSVLVEDLTGAGGFEEDVVTADAGCESAGVVRAARREALDA